MQLIRMPNIFSLPVASHPHAVSHPPIASHPPVASLLAITIFAICLEHCPNLCVSSLLQYDVFSHLRHSYFKTILMMRLCDFIKVCDTTQSVWNITC